MVCDTPIPVTVIVEWDHISPATGVGALMSVKIVLGGGYRSISQKYPGIETLLDWKCPVASVRMRG